MQSLFVTGTDTGIGKTLVTALLVLNLRARGIDAGVMKPIASGCSSMNSELVSEDARWLREVTGVHDELDLMNPIRLQEPLAPLVAARRANEKSGEFIERSLAAYEELQQRHDCVIVEGVGGLLAPLAERKGEIQTCADLANALGLPVAVVARRGLGTINHTLMTCATILQTPARFAGIVFCDAMPVEASDIAAATSPAIIAEMARLPVWASVPFIGDLSRANMEKASRLFGALNWD